MNPDGQEMEHGAASSSFRGRETKKGHSEEWPFLTKRGCASVMPDVMFNVEQFMLDAFGLCQSIQASRIGDNFSVESIVFLDNIAREIALLEQVLVGATLGVVEHVVDLAVGEDIATFGVIQPEERPEADAVSIDVKIFQHWRNAQNSDIAFAALTVPNPIFLDAVPRDFVGGELVALLEGPDDLPVFVVLFDQCDRIQDFSNAVRREGRGELVIVPKWSCAVRHEGTFHQQSFTHHVEEVLPVLDGVQREVERVVELLAHVDFLPDATLVHHIRLPQMRVRNDALGEVGLFDVCPVKNIGGLRQTLAHGRSKEHYKRQTNGQKLFHGSSFIR